MSEDNIKVFFIKSKSCEACDMSEFMLKAFEMCRQSSYSTQLVNEEDYKSINFVKSDFVVFENFEGECFEDLRETKCVRVLGPWCLITCLSKKIPIPNVNWPIYNVAMRDTFVCCSNISKELKNEIKMRIQLMSGQYADSLFEDCTHLITDSVTSFKYQKAVENGLKIMNTKWVNAVWSNSLKSITDSNNNEYDVYKVKPFENLIISTTGFTTVEERNSLIKMIQNNGGIYSGILNLAKTNILVCQHGTNTEKYKAAKNSKTIQCVPIEWIKDSISSGFSLPQDNYSLKRSTSTPTRDNEGPNFSMISVIAPSHSKTQLEFYNETINNTNCLLQTTTSKKRKSDEMDYVHMINKIDVKKAKCAGMFLDGCSIYLVGFEADSKEKLCKILDFSGATRYDNINEHITHCIVGNPDCHELKLIRNKGLLHFPVVSVNWLFACIEQEQPVNEEKFIINFVSTPVEQSSPLSQKGLNLLKRQTSLQEMPKKTRLNFNETDTENSLMQQYLKSRTKTEDDTLVQALQNNENLTKTGSEMSKSSYTQEDDTDFINIFDGYTFVIKDYDDSETIELKNQIEKMGGKVLTPSYRRIKKDYMVLPEFVGEPVKSSITTITRMWILDCFEDSEIKNILYYHKPIVVKEATPLKNCVISITNHKDHERRVLELLVLKLGAIMQNELSRIKKLELNILISTHLISPSPIGRKYESALKWKIPIINKDWLLECAKKGKMVPVESYSVEASTSTSSSKILTKVPLERSQNISKSHFPTESCMSIKSNVSKEEITNTISQDTSDKMHSNISTSVHNFSENDTSFPIDICTPVTPVHKILEDIRKNDLLGTPEVIKTPKPFGYVSTPETPLGAFINPNPSPNLKRAMAACLNRFPDYKTPPSRAARRLSTPLSELKKKLWDKICPPKELDYDISTEIENRPPPTKEIEEEKPSTATEQLDTQDIIFNEKLDLLENKLSVSSASKKLPRKRISTVSSHNEPTEVISSQPLTVGWDYSEPDNNVIETVTKPVHTFMLSGILDDQKKIMVTQLETLGGNVSNASSYDPTCSHLICSLPSRNEKILSCMAAGKWILHAKYVEACAAKKDFVPEELYEFGNPKFCESLPEMDANFENRCKAIHFWRNEISRRGYGAFHDVRAIVVASNRDAIIGVIKAGGGVVLDISPPFYDNIYATHCFLETKSINNIADYIPLARQGIYCVNTVYISEFLHQTKKSAKDSVLSYFSKYYKK